MSPGARVDERERHHGLLTQDEDVERVVVFGEGLRDEAVVGGIVDSRIQHAIQPDQPTLLVEFVLDARSEGYFDYRQKFLG